MQIIITFPSGFDVDGIILSATGLQMRVAIKDWDDAAEFECRDGQWFAENGDRVAVTWPKRSRQAAIACLLTDSLPDTPNSLPASTSWVN